MELMVFRISTFLIQTFFQTTVKAASIELKSESTISRLVPFFTVPFLTTSNTVSKKLNFVETPVYRIKKPF
ncbi:hypothetical protein DQM68_00985 [Leptospira mayottensis]|uniref:Uncharacterized protein n=2 Tax=Leptospira mayottensis TaxID=1137606 RepID=A0AA87MKZ3_9LEPT|nr:hypothetical protein DQM68_00985 [Leptospira mayottensis]AXR63282.1 hypothetical protein DQM28_02610 [Leptospira mayottensis]AZQ01181.1 hypothetical protein LEP1GSC190_03000 [Leptospira mayottensis 200901116]EKR98267.1 hypothetical protein LEP1GSC125_1079 [Leptospira mayottensis 200901122]TGM96739.1 hypothetical protein EHR03_15720 [Leptospira mayottensis]